MVTPADGPSLGTAPAGTWMWRSRFSKKSAAIPSRSPVRDIAEGCLRRLLHHIAEVPVRVNPFLPVILVDSTNMISPPIGVHAIPIATPVLRAFGDLGQKPLRAQEIVDAGGSMVTGSVWPR